MLTGEKKRAEIYTAFENIYHVLQEFKKGAGLAVAFPTESEPALPSGEEPELAVNKDVAQTLGAPAPNSTQ